MILTKDLTVGIIGGTGKTGSQFARMFRSQGFRVRVTGEKTKAKNMDLIQHSDVVLFALPLSHAAEIIKKELASATRTDQLILDVSSLKSRETAAMKTAPGEIIGMHPLFGPSTDPMGERIILCPARALPKTLRSLKAVLRSMRLVVTVMTPREHDHAMAMVQVVPHLKSMLMADVLRVLRTDLSSVLKTCTPTYEMEFNILGRFLDDHPDLYMPIIFENPRTVEILETLHALTGEYLDIAKTQNLPAAEKRYRACRAAFRPHLRRSRAHSEACIRTLLSLR